MEEFIKLDKVEIEKIDNKYCYIKSRDNDGLGVLSLLGYGKSEYCVVKDKIKVILDFKKVNRYIACINMNAKDLKAGISLFEKRLFPVEIQETHVVDTEDNRIDSQLEIDNVKVKKENGEDILIAEDSRCIFSRKAIINLNKFVDELVKKEAGVDKYKDEVQKYWGVMLTTDEESREIFEVCRME